MDAEAAIDVVSAPTIWLVRHASTDWTGRRWCGRRDLALNSTGRAEAVALAARLAPVLIRPRFVTSPLRRARQTAEILSTRVAVGSAERMTIDPDLAEVDFGLAEGRTFDEIAGAQPDLAAALLDGRVDVDWPGGERAAELRERVERAWHRLARPDGAGDVVVVTHGGVIARLLRSFDAGSDVGPATFAAPASALPIVRDGARWRVAA